MREDYKIQADRFYHSKEWKACRKYYIEKRRLVDGGMCEHCQGRLGQHLDHITELDIATLSDPMIALNHDNLQWLCQPCHTAKTFSKEKRRVLFDEEGQPIVIDMW